MWTDADVDLLLDEWVNNRPAPFELMERLPNPPHEFFERCLERYAERMSRQEGYSE